MICFLKEITLDYILYQPIVKILDESKLKYMFYDLEGKSTADALEFLTSNPQIKSIVSYGGSYRKATFALLCKEYEKKFINLHGDEKDYGENGLSFCGLISRLAYQNFVCADGAMSQLIEEGIETPIGIFECPITNLARKCNGEERYDIFYICGNKDLIKLHQNEFKTNGYSFKIFDYSNGLPKDWKSFYKHFRFSEYIVSDSFMFDKPSRYLNKHFFYLGGDCLTTEHLGLSTHLVHKNKRLNDYLSQPWKELPPINPKHGIQSLINSL